MYSINILILSRKKHTHKSCKHCLQLFKKFYVLFSKVVYKFSLVLNLCIASSVFSLLPKPVNLKYPSPLGPNPTPGVPTILASFSNLSKKVQESILFGVFSKYMASLLHQKIVIQGLTDLL